jgi:hypothetical protein
MTKTRLTMLTVVTVLSGAVVAGAAHADPYSHNLELINHAHAAVAAFYASNGGGEFGAKNLLDGSNLRPNHYVDLDLIDATGYCRFDFKTVYADGTSTIRRNIDACTFTKFELTN